MTQNPLHTPKRPYHETAMTIIMAAVELDALRQEKKTNLDNINRVRKSLDSWQSFFSHGAEGSFISSLDLYRNPIMETILQVYKTPIESYRNIPNSVQAVCKDISDGISMLQEEFSAIDRKSHNQNTIKELRDFLIIYNKEINRSISNRTYRECALAA